MKNLWILLMILALTACKKKITQQDYPDADACYIKVIKEYTLNEDGSSVFHYYHQLKLFSYLSFNSRYGESFILYNPKYQELKVNRSVTTMANNSVVPSPENAFNEVLPRFADNAAAYNHLREMVVSHTALEKNAVIELDYTITSKAGFAPALMINDVVNASSPTKEIEYFVRVPKKSKVAFSLTGPENIKVKQKEDGKTILYYWKAKDIQALSNEPLQPANNTSLYKFIFSTANSQQNLVKHITKQAAFKFDVNPALQTEIDELAKTDTNKLKLALNTQAKVVDEFNYFPVPLYLNGYKVRTASEIYNSNGGSELEKAILMKTIFNKLGISSDIVAISGEYNDNKFSIPLLFNNFILKVNYEQGKTIYLSPIHKDNQDLAFKMQGYAYYTLNNNIETNFFNKQDCCNTISVKGEFTIKNAKEYTASLDAEFTKSFNPYLKMSVDKETIKSLYPSTSKYEIISLTKDQLKAKFNIENKNTNTKEKYIFIPIPVSSAGFDSYGITSLSSKRSTPLELPYDLSENYEYTFKLPKELKPAMTPTGINISNSVGSVIIKISSNNDKIIVSKSIKINNTLIDPANYNDFRLLVNSWLNKNYKELILSL